MIKMMAAICRKPGITHAEYLAYVQHVHGAISNEQPLMLRRYVQNHIDGERTRPDIPTTAVEIDGVAELWFDDQAALETAAHTPEMKALHADGAKFIGRIKSYVVEEKFVIGS